MAISKAQKEAMLAEYMEWLAKSKAVVLVEYTGVKMKDLDAIRAKIRETGGEFHIVKNTLARRALEKAGYSVPADYREKSTAIVFAFNDPAAFAKALTDATKGMEVVKVKGGFLDAKALNPAQVKSLAIPAAAASRACPIAGRFASSRQQTGPHAGRTWPFPGSCDQGIRRQGSPCCGLAVVTT